jgi:hypothetical protein
MNKEDKGIKQLKNILKRYNENSDINEMTDSIQKLPVAILRLWNEIKK